MNKSRARSSTQPSSKKSSPPKTNKQKRANRVAKKTAKQAKLEAEKTAKEQQARSKLIVAKKREGVHVEFEKLARNRSYSPSPWPEFVVRGYYVDIPFVCKFCGGNFVFTAKWQKWWYETVGAKLSSRFNRCEPCQLKLNAAKQAKQKDDARRAAKNKIQKLRAAGKLTPELQKELEAAARK